MVFKVFALGKINYKTFVFLFNTKKDRIKFGLTPKDTKARVVRYAIIQSPIGDNPLLLGGLHITCIMDDFINILMKYRSKRKNVKIIAFTSFIFCKK